ncbi:hypothetical protein ABIB35_003607 [Arthrobacter sp. UYP6]|uniref:DUF4192 domain-containing protein n=1 Tax=Arthrobacter sp. UYP6 TaxID=1756378 RepID=UPI003396D4F9
MKNSRSQRRQGPFPVSGPADILAFIPHSLGFAPRESLVLMTVDSARLGATLRLDLPASALDYTDFAARVSEILRSDRSANGVLMALYTERSWKEPGVPPYRRLVTALGQSLADAGLPIKDGWVVSATTWREYFCEDSSCCPWPGHPLHDITNSTLSAEMVYRGSAFAQSLEEAVAMDLPPVWAGAGAASGHRAAYVRRLEGRWCGYSQFAGTLAVWDEFFSSVAKTGQGGSGEAGRYRESRALAEPKNSANPSGAAPNGADYGCPQLRADPEAVGFLLASLRVRPVRDTLLVMAALGREPALSGAVACRLLSRDAGDPLLPPGPEHHTVASASPPHRVPGDAGHVFRDVLVGQYRKTPQWRGMDAAFAVFAELLAADTADQETDHEATAALLSLLAWIEWARGRGSRAQVYLTRCLETLPGYRLAQLLEELLATGLFPVWAQKAATAWKGSSEQQQGSTRP